jgi:hypothetical protein
VVYLSVLPSQTWFLKYLVAFPEGISMKRVASDKKAYLIGQGHEDAIGWSRVFLIMSVGIYYIMIPQFAVRAFCVRLFMTCVFYSVCVCRMKTNKN